MRSTRFCHFDALDTGRMIEKWLNPTGAYVVEVWRWRKPYGNSKFPPALFFGDNFGVENSDLEKVLDTALAKKADYADLYFEYRQNEGISLEEGMVKNCSQSIANGVGVRVLAEAKTGYAYTDDITIEKFGAGGTHGPLHRAKPPFSHARAGWPATRRSPRSLSRLRLRSMTLTWRKKSGCFTRSTNLLAVWIHG